MVLEHKGLAHEPSYPEELATAFIDLAEYEYRGEAYARGVMANLMVQEVALRCSDRGVTLIAADSPSSFLDDGPIQTDQEPYPSSIRR
jgi:hypothetical protein